MKTNSVPKIRFKGFTDDWEQRKLGEIAERVQGNDGRMDLPTLTISAANGWMDQKERFSGNIAGKEQKKYTLLHKGELSYNHGNSKLAKYGTVFSLETYEEALVPRVYHSFKVINGSSKFIEYYFATKIPDRELAKLVSSGARMDGLLNINFNEFMGINLTVPNKSEQEKISNYFSNLDHLITLHQRKCEQTKELKKFMLQKMFPKNGESVPEIRFSGFTDDWEERKLSSGLREYTDRVIVEDDKEYYQISVRNNFGGITLRGSKIGNKIGRKRQAKINLTKYPQTLIFTRQTVEQGGIGWVDKYCDGAIVTENMPTISLDTSVFSKYFLTNLFQTRIFYKNAILDNIEGGSAQIAIHESKFLSSILLFPNLDEQEKIGQFFKQLDNTIALHQRKCEQLKELKKFMLQNMFPKKG